MITLLLTDEEFLALRSAIHQQLGDAGTELDRSITDRSPSAIAYWTTHLATIRLILAKVETLNDMRKESTHA